MASSSGSSRRSRWPVAGRYVYSSWDWWVHQRDECLCLLHHQQAMGQQAMKRLELSAAVHCMVQLFGQRMRDGKHMDGRTDSLAWQVVWPCSRHYKRKMLSVPSDAAT